MPFPASNRLRWLDDWLRSQKSELLEREGATSRGVRIIDELNKVYRRTGVLSQVAQLIGGELDRLWERRRAPLRVLEIGCRDGTLLGAVAQQAQRRGVQVALHGVEFRSNLVDLAQDRARAAAIDLQLHCAASPQLAEFADRSFDVVFSMFSLHHFDDAGLRTLLVAGRRLAGSVSLHVDLNRSLWWAVLVGLVYTLLRCRTVPADSVLSVRRARRIEEMRALTDALGLPATIRPLRAPPLYWVLRVPSPSGPG